VRGLVVYKYTNKVNGKVYIGITSRGLERRHKEHLMEVDRASRNLPFYNALRKYGEENFELEQIDTADSYDELLEKEKFYIKLYNSFVDSLDSNGYNATIGGDGIVGLDRSGEKNSFYGKNHTKETRKRMSVLKRKWIIENGHTRTGAKLSEETKRLIGQAHKGKTISEKQRKEQSKKMSGHKHPNSLKVKCITTGEVFNYMGEACEKYGIDRSNLTKHCKGKTRWCGKLPDGTPIKWEYYNS